MSFPFGPVGSKIDPSLPDQRRLPEELSKDHSNVREFTFGPFGSRVYAPMPIPKRADLSNGLSEDYFKLMRNALERVKTYYKYKWLYVHIQDPEQLAEAGFFYLGDSDRVQCPFCKLILKGWSPSDVPLFKHKMYSRHCDFIQGYDVGNKPLAEDPIRGPNPFFPNMDVVDVEMISDEDEYQKMDRYDEMNM